MIKYNIKKIFRIASVLCTLPLILPTKIETKISRGEAVFSFCAHLLGVVPGIVGNYLRRAYYCHTLLFCSSSMDINFGSFFSHKDAEIGENVCIGAYTIIGSAIIEKNTLIASRVSIMSGKAQHIYINDELTREVNLTKVRIGEHTWIGEGALIMSDVGDRCIISAGSVVYNRIPDDIVVYASPGKKIKRDLVERFKAAGTD